MKKVKLNVRLLFKKVRYVFYIMNKNQFDVLNQNYIPV